MVIPFGERTPPLTKFQYSLCRVVLMVEDLSDLEEQVGRFQYSLCRVVLMVVRWKIG